MKQFVWKVLAAAAAAVALTGVTVGLASGTTPETANRPAMEQFHPVVREAAANTRGLAVEYTVYRPADLDEIHGRLPVVVIGNGACRHLGNNELLATEMLVAAHGFVVVAVGAVDQPANDENGTPRPEVITDGITWAERENDRKGSDLRNRLDLNRVAVAGHSCGGLEALVAGADPRVKSVASLDSGFFADGRYGYGREELAKLHTPALFLDGGPSDVAHENSLANYDLATVPAVRATNPGAGHSGFWYGLRDGQVDAAMREEAVSVLVNWLDFTLNGNPVARDYFLGSCTLCATPGWEVAAKNFPVR
ncbi:MULTISPECIES: alpha/beta hydrolase [unclassified Amycolatopsis]|uniref:poly(ethylene terephthalate) hydrolase family protein n=1 Tax=unclassified Amycolatopsis TaxID=2618356 RepID=UPI00026261DB|nr:alpha/beta hydrolase [Amycolatopsis sp. ATCC 39116]